MIYTTKSAKETRNLGSKIAKSIKNGGIICLYGDLGSGKTTFMQGLLYGLGVKNRVVSPTFIFIKKYGEKIFHIDLYRIKWEQEAFGLGIKEIFGEPGNIVIIEWPGIIKNILPKKRMEIFFEYINENERRITTSN